MNTTMKYSAYSRWGETQRDDVIHQHLSLVYGVARRVANATNLGTTEVGDLINAGVIGLYKAYERYDQDKGVPFGGFAMCYVRGHMLDEIAKVRQIPRGLRDKTQKVTNTIHRLAQQLMREPHDAEVAGALGLSLETYHSWLVDIGWTSAFSVEELESTGGIQIIDEDIASSPEQQMNEREMKAQLIQAIKTLSLREQQVLSAYYDEELTLKEIGYVLDLSESQVSRIHSKAVLKLRSMLQQE